MEQSDFKVLFIFPPPASPVSPYLSAPLLAGQLKKKGYNVKNLDLSVEFFNYVLQKDYLENAFEKAKIEYSKLEIKFKDKFIDNAKFKTYSFNDKIDILRKKHIQSYIENEFETKTIINNIDTYIHSYRDKNIFYDIKQIEEITKKLYKALDIAILPYYPCQLLFNKYYNPIYKTNYKGIKEQIYNKNNIFYDFYKQKIKEFDINKYDLVCITCPNETQILPSLILSSLIKKSSNTKVVIGGNIISRIDKELKNFSEAFDLFYDYIIIGCGEDSIVKLADYISGKNNIDKKSIFGLMYKSDNKIHFNKPDLKYNIVKSARMTLEGINLEKYFTPDIIIPIQASKGCYWGKCTFCGLHYPPKKYSIRKPQDVVAEIEYLNKQYGIKYFEFIDEALAPKYLINIAKEILARNLDINYVCCARLEKGIYTKQNCDLLYQSGLRLVQFGFETACKRIYKILNKGIKYDGRFDIIKLFAESGIYTYIFAIIGYPSETKEEAMETLTVYEKYKDIVDTLFIHIFWLDKKSPVFKKYKKFFIEEISSNKNNIFKQQLDFVSITGMTNNEVNSLYNKNIEKNPLKDYILFAPDEYYFLYVLHYGRKKIKEILL